MEMCFEWEIEVDQNRQGCNLEAQEKFITSFVGSIYKDIDAGYTPLSKISSLHFTRIFQPARDKIGAYVRLRVFAEEADLKTVKPEIDKRLEESKNSMPTFQVKKTEVNWPKACEQYGGQEIAPIFRDYLDSISRISYQLLLLKAKGVNVESTLWPWTHFFFNMIRGYGRGVLELHQGVVTDFIANV